MAGTDGQTASREEVPWAVRRLFEALARSRPLIVVVDDLHWAEPALLDLLEHVARFASDAPILIVGIARPELLDDRPDWGVRDPEVAVMMLEPLGEGECGRLVGNLLGGGGVSTADGRRHRQGRRRQPAVHRGAHRGADRPEVARPLRRRMGGHRRPGRRPHPGRRVRAAGSPPGSARRRGAGGPGAGERRRPGVRPAGGRRALASARALGGGATPRHAGPQTADPCRGSGRRRRR